jgi:hypothetical protein
MKVSATWEWETARLGRRALQKQEEPKTHPHLAGNDGFSPSSHREWGRVCGVG